MTENSMRRAVLVSIAESGSSVADCEKSLNELERLLDTAGGVAAARVIQVKEKFDPRTCIGSGKVLEIKDICSREGIDLIIFDFELTPAQIRNIEDDIGLEVDVIDRSMLILDIFAKNATSGEGKLQVQLAQLRYSAPRLIGKGTELSRQGGGIGSRGPGESKLETDRRHVREKIASLEKRLEELEQNRLVMRAQRDRSGMCKVALVGYTNAGKSSLLNRLTDAGVLAENKLFATLDPTTRKLTLPGGDTALLTDTVGFINKLPHHLVKAFRSTLDEVSYADVLVIVCDAGDPEVEEQLAVTQGVIADLGGADKPTLIAYNKCDTADNLLGVSKEGAVRISALTGEGIDELLLKIDELVHLTSRRLDLLIPYTEQNIVSSLYNSYTVNEVEYREDGIYVNATLDGRGLGLYSKYIIE
ncbi:MAG: GTPase HflX [Clostridia bacterium]|nr:GTPase HflX [Clostridia bacterium]